MYPYLSLSIYISHIYIYHIHVYIYYINIYIYIRYIYIYCIHISTYVIYTTYKIFRTEYTIFELIHVLDRFLIIRECLNIFRISLQYAIWNYLVKRVPNTISGNKDKLSKLNKRK